MLCRPGRLWAKGCRSFVPSSCCIRSVSALKRLSPQIANHFVPVLVWLSDQGTIQLNDAAYNMSPLGACCARRRFFVSISFGGYPRVSYISYVLRMAILEYTRRNPQLYEALTFSLLRL